MIRRFFLERSDKFISHWLILLMDVLIVLVSAPFTFWLVFNLRSEVLFAHNIIQYCGIALFAYLVGFLSTKSYRGVIRHTSIEDALNILKAMLIALALLVFINMIIEDTGFLEIRFPYALIILHALFSAFCLIVFRLTTKLAYYKLMYPRSYQENVVVYGAGEIGLLTKNALTNDSDASKKVHAFIDDNKYKVNKTIQGVPVLGSKALTSKFLNQNEIRSLILSVDNLSIAKKGWLVDLCIENQVVIKQAPPLKSWMQGKISSSQIRKMRIDDLLQRQPLELSNDHLVDYFVGRKVMVTGAAGSIGSEIAKQLILNNASRIILVDHAETPIFNLLNQFKSEGLDVSRIKEHIVSVNHNQRIEEIFKSEEPDIVFHAAALKHVPLMEKHPDAAFETNVIGSQVMANLAGKYGVEKFVLVSTDKAVRPTSVMGATKRLAEMYVKSLNDSHQFRTKYIITRFGNVLGSNGSVIPSFKDQIERGGPITVTHEKITRYFMTIPEACHLVLEAGVMGNGGETYIFDMGEPVKIIDLAKKMIALSGLRPDVDISIEITGLRPGEKLYEELWHGNEQRLNTHHDKIMIAETSQSSLSETDEMINGISSVFDGVENPRYLENGKKAILYFANPEVEATDFGPVKSTR